MCLHSHSLSLRWLLWLLKPCNRWESSDSFTGRLEEVQKHTQMFTEQCCYYVTFVCWVLLPHWEFMWQWEKRALSVTLVLLETADLSRIPCCCLSPWSSISWELDGPQTSHSSQTRYSTVHPRSESIHVPPLLPFFCPCFLSSLCLSIMSSLSFSLRLSPQTSPPCNQGLWSGPRRWIRVGPAGSLTWGESGMSN